MRKKYRKQDTGRYRAILSGTDDIKEEILPDPEVPKEPAIRAKEIYAAMNRAQQTPIAKPSPKPAPTPTKQKLDTFAKLKIGANEVYRILVHAITEPTGKMNGIYLLLMLSGLAGVACQKAAGELETDAETYLVKNRLSVCNLAAGTFHKLHPDLVVPKTRPIAYHVLKNRENSAYMIGNIPVRQYAGRYQQLWKYFQPILQKCCTGPAEYPILYGLALQKGMEKTDEAANPEFMIRFVIENAIDAAY